MIMFVRGLRKVFSVSRKSKLDIYELIGKAFPLLYREDPLREPNLIPDSTLSLAAGPKKDRFDESTLKGIVTRAGNFSFKKEEFWIHSLRRHALQRLSTVILYWFTELPYERQGYLISALILGAKYEMNDSIRDLWLFRLYDTLIAVDDMKGVSRDELMSLLLRGIVDIRAYLISRQGQGYNGEETFRLVDSLLHNYLPSKFVLDLASISGANDGT